MTRGSDRGQATVELALCLPILALVLGGIVETGALIVDSIRVWHAAREAARIAAVSPDPREIAAAAERGGLEPLHLEVDPDAAARRPGDPVHVTVTYEPRASVPVVGVLFERFRLSADVTTRIEQP